MKKTAVSLIFLLALFSVLTSPLYADNLTQGDLLFSLDSVYADSAPPAGTPPWLTATFENVGANSVQLTMAYSALDAGSSDYVGSWFFNFNPAQDLFGLNFSYVTGIAAGPINPITLSVDGVPAGGGLLFNIQFSFAANNFNPGDSSVYLISSPSDPINADSFRFLSAGGSTNYYSSANILSTGSWIASATAQTPTPGPGPGPTPVPEPATVVLLGLALTGLTFFYGKRNTA
jgi:hypothetical protein